MDQAENVEARGQELALRYMALRKEQEDVMAELYTVMGRLVRPTLWNRLRAAGNPDLTETAVLDEGDLLSHIHMTVCGVLDQQGFCPDFEFKTWVSGIADTELKESLRSLGFEQ